SSPLQWNYGSYGTHATDNSRNRTKNNGTIQKQILIPDVVKVILQIFVNRKCPCRTDLPQSRYPWFCRKSFALGRMIASYNERHLRPRTNQAHLTFKNIDKLRKLIEAQAPKYATDPGQTTIHGASGR